MKASMLKGVVTLEMEKDEALALAVALENAVARYMFTYSADAMLNSVAWDNLAIAGKAKDELSKLLGAVG